MPPRRVYKRSPVPDPLGMPIKFSFLFTCLLLCLPRVALADMPEHAQSNMFGRGWDCEEGYVRKANACVRLELPPHAQVNLLQDDWECRKGYVKDADSCRPMPVPLNAIADSFGNGWRCARGYFQHEDQCDRLKVPSHAQLDPSGNDWECVRGYKKNADVCVEMDPEERAREERHYRELYAGPPADDNFKTAPCRAGYNKCTSDCAGLEKKTIDLLARHDDPLQLCFQACDAGQAACVDDRSEVPCRQFTPLCQAACPSGVDLCLNACQTGGDRCVYQSRRLQSR